MFYKRILAAFMCAAMATGITAPSYAEDAVVDTVSEETEVQEEFQADVEVPLIEETEDITENAALSVPEDSHKVETLLTDAGEIYDRYEKASRSMNAFSGDIQGTASISAKLDAEASPLEITGNASLNTAFSREPFGACITADISGKAGGKEAETSFEFYMAPDKDTSSGFVPVYFGQNSKKEDKVVTQWTHVNIPQSYVEGLYKTESSDAASEDAVPENVSLDPLFFVPDKVKFQLARNGAKIDGEDCYVLLADIGSEEIIDWYKKTITDKLGTVITVPQVNASSSAASGIMGGMYKTDTPVQGASSSAAAASSLETKTVSVPFIPEYDRLFKSLVAPLKIRLELDISRNTFLPCRAHINLDGSDFEALSKAVSDYMGIKDSEGSIKDILLNVKNCSIDYFYNYDNIKDIAVPAEAVNKAVLLEPKEETVRKSNVQEKSEEDVFTPSASAPSGAILPSGPAAASASASASVLSGEEEDIDEIETEKSLIYKYETQK